MVIRSQAEAIKLLEKENKKLLEENKELKQKIEELEDELYMCEQLM